MISFINKLFASVLFIGFIKGGGTIVALIITVLFYYMNNNLIFFLIMSITIILGTISSEYAEKEWGYDSSKIVIDEAAGILLALYLLPHNFLYFFIAFVLFRFFDIVKIFPINKLQKIYGGAGIMLDDIVSGIFANLIVWSFIWIRGMLF